ncbi:NAD kinase [Epidermidibacterium keratini]|uniref:NAD kinase n=1 Tax=Epidermidibacterium keratini TaxID=1891644 RepID=A0A7L4YI85_9ACTN|nr:NAD kinase [Epidermidibacterium keratini]QHB98937.1 NAD kinase [Epidermidibacterium keratini]
MPRRQRAVILVTHAGRPDVVELARQVVAQLQDADTRVYAPAEEIAPLGCTDVVPLPEPDESGQVLIDELEPEFVVVLGGDGTFLRAAEYAHPSGAAMLGVNLGHVGFLAETEPEMVTEAIDHLLGGTYRIEERLALQAAVFDPKRSREVRRTWALNEVSLEKTRRERILEIAIGVDGHPLTSFGCDGILCATPTGSTAYAFSAGGPVVWPQVEAMLVVPNAAHALFARPLVVAPTSVITLDVAPHDHDAILAADGRRLITVPAGHRVVIQRDPRPIRVARFHTEDFADRLVAKFRLPTSGFRGL